VKYSIRYYGQENVQPDYAIELKLELKYAKVKTMNREANFPRLTPSIG